MSSVVFLVALSPMTDTLTKLETATRQLHKAREEWLRALRDARQAGHSLQQVAEAAGLNSRQHAHKLLR